MDVIITYVMVMIRLATGYERYTNVPILDKRFRIGALLNFNEGDRNSYAFHRKCLSSCFSHLKSARMINTEQLKIVLHRIYS